jgi:hypothetical protein
LKIYRALIVAFALTFAAFAQVPWPTYPVQTKMDIYKVVSDNGTGVAILTVNDSTLPLGITQNGVYTSSGNVQVMTGNGASQVLVNPASTPVIDGELVSGINGNVTGFAPAIDGHQHCYLGYVVSLGTGGGLAGTYVWVAVQPVCSTFTVGATGNATQDIFSGTGLSAPSPLGTNNCPTTASFFPVGYLSDGSAYYTYYGINQTNTGVNPPGPYNKLEFCRPVWFDDTKDATPDGLNAFIVISHVQNGTTVGVANQDRGLHIETFNCEPVVSCLDSSTHQGMEGIQVEQQVAGSPTYAGIDSEATAGSFQVGIFATADYRTGLGSNSIRASTYRESNSHIDQAGMNGGTFTFSNLSFLNAGGGLASGVTGFCQNQIGSPALGLACSAFSAIQPSAIGGNFQNGFSALSMAANAYAPSGTGPDYFLRNDHYNYPSVLGGAAYFTQWRPSNDTIVSTMGELLVNGSITAVQQAAPTMSNPSCGGGGNTYTYVAVGVDQNGGSVTGSTRTVISCSNPLTVGTPAVLNWPSTNPANNLDLGRFDHIDVYRTSGPMSTGKIGCVGNAASACVWKCANSSYSNGFTCSNTFDTGLVGDGTTPPVANSTGGIITNSAKYIPVLFSTLPACTTAFAGLRQEISDPATLVWGAVATGTGVPGATSEEVHCNGVNWTVVAI